jgi:hypothetical protein
MGSSSNCVVIESVDRQHPRPQEFGAGSAVHSALEGLETVDLPFGLAVAPRQLDGVPDGIDVASYGPPETLHANNAGALRIVSPILVPPDQVRRIAPKALDYKEIAVFS